MDNKARIHVAGHTGLVGSAITRRLQAGGFRNLLVRDLHELDLTDARATNAFYAEHKPEYVFVAAAKVGGIAANDRYPADFIRINLMIELNLIEAAFRHGVKKLLFLGSTCIYPKLCPQPMREEYLLTGPLEPTNDAYAIAKIAGILMCKSYNRQHGTNFIAAMPTNLYGPHDNFDLQSSHVLPAMIRKMHEAKQAGAPEVKLWGTGAPRREFLYVDDLADALVFLMERFDADPKRPDDLFVNVGVGEDLEIRELAAMVKDVVGYPGKLAWDPAMPDGTPRKLVDVSRINALGWKAKISLRDGIEKTYGWYLDHKTG
ncbi:MAG TPA: GDP-L-fucose synthase [Myxococcota bacterium]|nr:GDP-L-fucose synthase [Myxococcota bacterium]HRY93136.1 GDP-L-fucose synthase [Myxococcota bacterium]